VLVGGEAEPVAGDALGLRGNASGVRLRALFQDGESRRVVRRVVPLGAFVGVVGVVLLGLGRFFGRGAVPLGAVDRRPGGLPAVAVAAEHADAVGIGVLGVGHFSTPPAMHSRCAPAAFSNGVSNSPPHA